MNNETQARLDFESLIHPARSFAHPMDVVRSNMLTHAEKKAVLASWASDACAIEAAPDLRAVAGQTPVKWDDIMDAMQVLDGVTASPKGSARAQ